MYRGGSRIRPKKIRKMPSGRYRYKHLLFQFLRPQEESVEEVWKKAITILCYVVAILRKCCELTEFRQTSFGSTYMTLLGFARVLKVLATVDHPSDEMSTLLRKSREGCISPRKRNHDTWKIGETAISIILPCTLQGWQQGMSLTQL